MVFRFSVLTGIKTVFRFPFLVAGQQWGNPRTLPETFFGISTQE